MIAKVVIVASGLGNFAIASRSSPRLTAALGRAAAAKRIVREVFTAVSNWRKTSRQLRLKASTLAAYASAFENPLMDEAGRLIGR